jgi:hypothetical protein
LKAARKKKKPHLSYWDKNKLNDNGFYIRNHKSEAAEVTHMVECLPSKYKALSSSSSTALPTKKEES